MAWERLTARQFAKHRRDGQRRTVSCPLISRLEYAHSAMSVPYRDHFTEPANLGEGFRLHKDRCGRQLEAICWLRTHPLGWELALNVNGNLQRSELCRSQDAVLDLTERWKAGMIEKGWQ